MYVQLSIFPEDNKNESKTKPHKRQKKPICVSPNGQQDTNTQHQSCCDARRYPSVNGDMKITGVATCYGIRDKVADTLSCVFISYNDQAAERQFFDLLSSPDATVFSINPNDFELVRFGSVPELVRAGHDYSDELLDKIRAERLAAFRNHVTEKPKE